MKLIFCKCGCNEKISKHDKQKRLRMYKNGHQNRGKNHPNYGKILSDEYKKRISDSVKKSKNFTKKSQYEIYCKCGCGEKLLKYDKLWREREYIIGHYMRINHPQKGKKMSDEDKLKISGKNHHMFGKRHSDETKQKMKNAWTDEMKKVVSERRKNQILPVENTSIETKIQNKLSSSGISFKTHYPVRMFRGFHQCDIFVPSKNLIIECDGCYWHGCEECGYDKNKTDLQRKTELNDKRTPIHDYEIIRFWEHDINKNLDECFNIIKDKIKQPDFHVCIKCSEPYADKFNFPLCDDCTPR